jgi:PAB1-binding protein PBP1
VPKIPAFLTAALLTAAGFASAAEAHGLGFHSPMFFRDEGPMEMEPPHHHCQAREDREFAIEQRELAEMRAEQAAGAAQKAAAAKRARMLAMRKEEARQEAREEAARQAAANAAKAQQIQEPVKAAAVAPKGDLLPATGGSPASGTTNATSIETKTAAVSETASVTPASDQQVCRKYSAAADGLIDTPCR